MRPVIIFLFATFILAGCKSQKQLQTSQSVTTDSLAHSEHHRTLEALNVERSSFIAQFDTLKIEIERPSSVGEATEVIRLKAVKGRVIDRRQMFRDSVEAYNSLDTVRYRQSAIEASTEHTATTRAYNPPNGTAICIVAIVIAGVLIYVFCRKR